ncbi:MAG: AMP-binding protein [Pikeienuella sp.]
MNVAEWLSRTAATRPDAPAILLGAEPWADYGAFDAKVGALAHSLRNRGIKVGDRVAVFSKNCPECLVAFFAIWRAGAVITPINAKLHAKEAAWIIEDSGAVLAFVGSDMRDELAAVCNIPLISFDGSAFGEMLHGEILPITPCDREDLAWLFYTSGTTGRPKGVMITHGMLMAASLSFPVSVASMGPEDGALYAAPMSHGAGFYALLHVLTGGRHIFPASAGFDEAEVLDLSARIGPTAMFMAPTMVRRLTDYACSHDLRGDGIGTIIYGGGPMYVADIMEATAWFGPKFVQIYGQGEAPMAISALTREEVADRSHPNWRARLGSVGRAQAVVELQIADENGAALPVGEVGEIMVRGALVMKGYWRNEAATAKTIRDGWLLTGDVGSLDADGFLTMKDRSKDMIISGGTNIYPREVEEALLTHPSVHEVSVVGRPSAQWGEDVVAFVVLADGRPLDEAALDAHCLAEIARFKRPKAYFAIDALPKNNYGKVLKTDLRARLNA